MWPANQFDSTVRLGATSRHQVVPAPNLGRREQDHARAQQPPVDSGPNQYPSPVVVGYSLAQLPTSPENTQ